MKIKELNLCLGVHIGDGVSGNVLHLQILIALSIKSLAVHI